MCWYDGCHVWIFGYSVYLMYTGFGIILCAAVTTRKKLINDTFNASLKSYNDTFLKRHGLACHCISLHIMTFILSVIFVNQNYDIHLKRHFVLVMF